jgi:hypothetical protein
MRKNVGVNRRGFSNYCRHLGHRMAVHDVRPHPKTDRLSRVFPQLAVLWP